MSHQPNRREFVGTIAVFSLFRQGKMSSFHATKLDISTREWRFAHFAESIRDARKWQAPRGPRKRFVPVKRAY
jgi:hypothetical protein